MLEIFAEGWRHLARNAIDADARGDSDERRAKLRVFGDVDLLATSKSGLQLLGDTGAGSKPSDQSEAGFPELVRPALIGGKLVRDVLVSTRDGRPPIHVGSPRFSVVLPRIAVAVTIPSASNATLDRFPFGSVKVAALTTR